MSPRLYQSEVRRAGADDTRERIITAARDLLAAGGEERFTVERVARRANVARMTVYYQFHSRAGLIEALFDDVAQRGGLLTLLPGVFHEPDAGAALAAFVHAFGQFWTSDRHIVRAVRAMAVLDPELGAALASRDARRFAGAAAALRKLGIADPAGTTATLVAALTSFEFFDAVAGPDRTPAEVSPLVLRTVRQALNLTADP